jgi:Ca2+-binding EF-hand superfamily protein
MKKLVLLATVAGIAVAIPAIAQMADEGDGMKMGKSMTFVAVEAKVKEHFAMADANKDGYIVKEEADAAHEKMMSEVRDRHFAELDANKDGSISRAEFDAGHAMMGGPRGAGHKDGEQAGHMRGRGHDGGMMGGKMEASMFEHADTDKDGRVSLAEALAMPKAHFEMMDANKDGTVTPEERKAARGKMHDEWRDKQG